jgi:hypothetical protein
MLSILRVQAKQLEKELLDTRQELTQLKRSEAEHATTLAERDSKIAALEEELAARVVEEESVPAAAPEPVELVTDDVLKKLDELKKQLRATESKLTSVTLEKSLAELQLLTHTSKIRRDLTRDLDGAQAAAKAAAAKAATELQAARAAERAARNELAARDVELGELRAGTRRRDQQIEFLMQVHDASQSCEWIDTTGGGGGGGGGGVVGGSSSLGGGCSTTGESVMISSSLTQLLGLGVGSPVRSSVSNNGINTPRGSGFAVARSLTGPWACSACTLRNDAVRTMCEACGTDRPGL